MMDVKRVFLYTLWCFLGLSLWAAWQQDYQPKAPVVVEQPASSLPASSNGTVATTATPTPSATQAAPANRLIHVKTDTLDAQIDTLGGSLVSVNLLKYKAKLHEEQPFQLLNQDADKFTVARSDVFSKGQLESIQYQASAPSYTLAAGEPSLQVVLTGETANHIQVRKMYVFKAGQYQIPVQMEIINKSSAPWVGNIALQLVQNHKEAVKSSMMGISSYEGGAISNPSDKRYQKISYKDMAKEPLDKTIEGGWLALQEHYFLTAWIPEKQSNHYYSQNQGSVYTLGTTTPEITLPVGGQKVINQSLYVGPELTSVLEKVAPNLDLTIDYGILWFFSAFIFRIMKALHEILGNCGWSIILVTCLIKLFFMPLSAKSYRSMAAMRKLQPKLEAIKLRYENDKAELTKKTWELYQKEKVNPFGGCLPILIQIPVFIALYWVLLESVELRQAPFILWIQDLSAKDPYFVLPVIMGLSMFIQQKLNPPAADPMQQNMMMILPIVFTALFLYFPAGLVLYWVVNNVLSILQQWYVTRQYERSHEKS